MPFFSRLPISWKALLDPAGTGNFFAPGPPAPFRAGAQGFDPVNAWWLCELSRLIYLRDAEESWDTGSGLSRNDILADFGLSERRFFNKPQVQGALIESCNDQNPFAVLVFRGTRGRVPNWLTNLDVLPAPWPGGGLVHSGFKRLFLQIWPDIEEELGRLIKPVFYTGHSLGGALATLAAAMAPPRALYTFGSPRVGDAAFAESVKSVQIFRIATPRDIVTNLPPSLGSIVYRHAGTKADQSPCPSLATIPVNNDEDKPGNAPKAEGLWHRLASSPPDFLADHAPSKYRALFEGA